MQVLSGFEDGSLALWDERQPGQALAAARGHSEPVMCLHVGGRPRGDEVPHDDEGRRPGAGDGPASRQRQKQRGGMTASSGSADDTLCFWSLSGEAEDGGAAAEEVEEVIGHGGEQGGMARSAAGGAGGTAGCVRGALRKVHEVKLPVPGCNHLACSADGRVLASAGWDGKVRLFSASKKRRPLAVLEYHAAQVRLKRVSTFTLREALSISPTPLTGGLHPHPPLTVSDSSAVSSFNRTCSYLPYLPCPYSPRPAVLCPVPTRPALTHCFSLPCSHSLLFIRRPPSPSLMQVTDVCWQPVGTTQQPLLASASRDRTVAIWDVMGGDR